jgi:hypothetical protein
MKNMKYALFIASLITLLINATATVLEQVEFDWGAVSATAVSADYDGDGLADPALYIESAGTWNVLLSSQGYAEQSAAFGGAGWRPVVGDFDGDSKTDLTVYRESSGEWVVSLSANGYQSQLAVLGGQGYAPATADYDGDGITEVGVYNSSSGKWYLWRHVEQEVTDTNVLATMYYNAMLNASNVVAGKIRHDLASITDDNTNLVWRTNPDTGVREVLVVSFMGHSTATNYYRVGQYTIMKYAESWVTPVPDARNFCRNYTGTNLSLRLKQMLGLPLTSGNDTIVEFYVNPLYLLRPSRDPEITDHESEVAFRPNTPYADMVSTNYQNWFQRTIASRNYGMTNGVWNAFPWTQLGYTYDWLKTGNNVMGFSEFVLPGSMLYSSYGITATVYVVTSTGVLDYATSPDNPTVTPQGAAINIVPPDVR